MIARLTLRVVSKIGTKYCWVDSRTRSPPPSKALLARVRLLLSRKAYAQGTTPSLRYCPRTPSRTRSTLIHHNAHLGREREKGGGSLGMITAEIDVWVRPRPDYQELGLTCFGMLPLVPQPINSPAREQTSLSFSSSPAAFLFRIPCPSWAHLLSPRTARARRADLDGL